MGKRIRMRLTISPINLRAMFDKIGLDTNQKVADTLGVSAFTVNQFYHEKPLSPATGVKIANALDLKPDDIAQTLE